MKTILIADNDKRFKKGLSILLKKQGVKAVEAAALSSMERSGQTLDAAVISLDIPFTEREQLLSRLSRLLSHNSLIILTTSEDALELPEHDVIRVLKKPFSFQEFIQAVNKYSETIAAYNKGVCHE